MLELRQNHGVSVTELPAYFKTLSQLRVVVLCGTVVPAATPGPEIVPGGLSAVASMDASGSSAMFFLNDLMPLAKSPIKPLTLPLPNSSRTTISTTSQCQMLKLPINSSDEGRTRPTLSGQAPVHRGPI